MQNASGKHAHGKTVLVFAGGGLSHVSGGVGTLMRYVMDVWAEDPASLAVRVVDTRGAGGAASGALRFAASIVRLAVGGLAGRAACAHIHMTTRGSAWRKAALCALARSLGVPVLLHLHGADFFDFHAGLPPVGRRVLRACICQADCVVIGARWRDRLVRDLAVEPDRVRVVANGVPSAPCAAGSDGPVHILFLGRLGTRKGCRSWSKPWPP